MGPGPYGDGGSCKYLLSSLDTSLRRLGLDYVDIFYPATPLEETLAVLHDAVRSGRALYAGGTVQTFGVSAVTGPWRTPDNQAFPAQTRSPASSGNVSTPNVWTLPQSIATGTSSTRC